MAALAKSLASVECSHVVAATLVLGQSHRLKVCGIHAAAIATKVVEAKAVGDRGNEQFVGETVS